MVMDLLSYEFGPHTASALALVKPFTTDVQENNLVVDTGEIMVELSNPEKMKFSM